MSGVQTPSTEASVITQLLQANLQLLQQLRTSMGGGAGSDNGTQHGLKFGRQMIDRADPLMVKEEG